MLRYPLYPNIAVDIAIVIMELLKTSRALGKVNACFDVDSDRVSNAVVAPRPQTTPAIMLEKTKCGSVLEAFLSKYGFEKSFITK